MLLSEVLPHFLQDWSYKLRLHCQENDICFLDHLNTTSMMRVCTIKPGCPSLLTQTCGVSIYERKV